MNRPPAAPAVRKPGAAAAARTAHPRPARRRAWLSRRPRDLPLGTDGSTRFLPWLVALMVYLAALAIAAVTIFDAAIADWDRGLSGTLTVQLPRIAQVLPGRPAPKPEDVLGVLRATPGIASAILLDRKAEAALLEPWLGASLNLDLLPVPLLIDVRLGDAGPGGSRPDKASVTARLSEIYPGAVVEDNGRWLDRLLAVGRLVEYVALGVVGLIAGAAVLTVVFATRTGLLVHAGVIELLHVMGARDRYVARQFQWHAFDLALRGGTLGLLAAALTLGALQFASGAAGLGGGERLLPWLGLRPWGWAALVLLPVCAGLIGLVTARLTVLRTLARLP